MRSSRLYSKDAPPIGNDIDGRPRTSYRDEDDPLLQKLIEVHGPERAEREQKEIANCGP